MMSISRLLSFSFIALGGRSMADQLGLFNAPSTILRASPPSVRPNPKLGPLTDLPGTWVGSGFTVIWLPVFGEHPGFRLKLNATSETLTITKIGGDIPNRGSVQPDLNFLGLHYLQLVSDALTHGQLHIEPGLWLNLPLTPPDPNPTVSFVARLASIPHGSALLSNSQARLSGCKYLARTARAPTGAGDAGQRGPAAGNSVGLRQKSQSRPLGS